ncbi:hypothetical protein HEP_00502600, partial [Hepatocystis sp. ex Piliocolobus tephrosceles]
MINIKLEELRRSSEVDHCANCNLLSETSIEFVIIKNKDLYIYKYYKKKKKNYLLYETKLNCPVIQLGILKNVFIKRKKEKKKKKNIIFSGILLIYKNLDFVIYKFKKKLNTLIIVLKHTFLKEIKFASLFYTLPYATNYTHRFFKKRENIKKVYNANSSTSDNIRKDGVSDSKLSDVISHDDQADGLHVDSLDTFFENTIPTLSRNLLFLSHKYKQKNKINKKKHLKKKLYEKNYLENKILSITNIFHNSLNKLEKKKKLKKLKKYIKSKKFIKIKENNCNFCEFNISFSYDFKTIYTFFYTTKKKKNNMLYYEKKKEIKTIYFSYDLLLENITIIDLENIYKSFIFIKKIFFHNSNAHIWIQKKP